MTIYGKLSSRFAYMKNSIKSICDKADISFELVEVTKTEAFIEKRIMSIPAYQLNGEIKERGTKKWYEFFNEMQLDILKHADFGNMKKILIPVNFTETSENAISYGINLSRHFNVAIKLVNAYHPSPIVSGGVYLDPEAASDREKKLDDLAQELNKSWVGNSNAPLIDWELKIGFAIDELLAISSEHPNDWIVVGSSNSSKTVKNIFGSISIALAKNSQCPVFIIPPGARFSPLNRIAFCSSDVNLDVGAINDLLDIARIFRSEIHIIHFGNENDYGAFNFLNLLKNKYPKDKIEFSALAGDSLVEVVNNYCHSNDIDLLSMARRKKGILGELFHKSATKQMTITTDTPLLILHK